jgi:GNAT superfamily N-acetyltransferase
MIRSAVPADGPAVAAMALAFMRYHDRLKPGAWVPADDFELQWLDRFPALMADPNGMIWVADPGDGTLCGYCIGTLRRRPSLIGGELVANLDEIFVTDSHRSVGIGAQLLAACQNWAAAAGAVNLSLRLEAANEQAASFYLAHGFTVHARILRTDLTSAR